jgi:mannose-6-phosphate isomerase-like protein (cupin superfamily)
LKNYNEITWQLLEEWLAETPGEPVSPAAIMEAEETFLNYAKAHSLAPPAFLREKILAKINELDAPQSHRAKLQLDQLPLLADNSNWLDWQEAVIGIEPPAEFENIHLHPLESNEKRELFVAWVKEMVEEEVHTDILESFLILEGSCECHVTDLKGETRIVRLGQGDTITLQIGEIHDIVITSLKPTKAILEWRKMAA